MEPIDIRPEKLAEEMADYSRKLGKGLENLLNTTEIDTGVTPRQAIYREDKLTLYRYQGADGVTQNPVPTLIVYALVNRPYMADIQEDRSTIRNLLNEGQDVFLIDWGYPDGSDSSLTWMITSTVISIVALMLFASSDQEKINILGICQGGAFSLCYTALNQGKVKI